MSAPTYRLPDWLGGHEVQVRSNLPADEWGSHVDIQIVGAPDSTVTEFPLHWLVEVRPPSIDDPEPLPLKIRAMAGGLNVDVVLCTTYPDGAQLKIDDSDDAIHANLTPDGLRRLARAAWQRANAVERERAS